MRKWYLGFLLLLSVSANIYANPANEEIKIRITDENQKPIFGVYFILKKQFTLLATSDKGKELSRSILYNLPIPLYSKA